MGEGELHFAGRNSGLVNLHITTTDATTELERRFPGVAKLFATTLVAPNPSGSVLVTIELKTSNLWLENLMLATEFEGMVRIRHIRLGMVISKSDTEAQYSDYLSERFVLEDGSSPHGVTMLSRGENENVFLGAQFANAVFMDKLHETSLGSFLTDHEDILKAGLDAQQIIGEPSVEWQAPSPDPDEKAINPDLFVQRNDGTWDIFDLKLRY